MRKMLKTFSFCRSGVLVCCLTLATIVFAGSGEHPMEGTVTALGTSQETTGSGGSTPVYTYVHRTYTVKTPTRMFVLECPYQMGGLHIGGPSECGGKKKIGIGDSIHFRVEKNHAYVLTDQGKDQKLNIVSEAMGEAGNRPPATPQR